MPVNMAEIAAAEQDTVVSTLRQLRSSAEAAQPQRVATTLTLESAIAAEATTGLSSPTAASGRAARL